MAIGGDSNIPSVDHASTFMLQYGQFEAAHKQQIEASGLPKHLWQVLYRKLAGEVFDIGEYVVFKDASGEKDATSRGITEHSLCLKKDKIEAFSNVFLVDHAWTTAIDQAIQQLDSVPGLLERMEKLTGIYDTSASGSGGSGANDSADDALAEDIEVNAPVLAAQAGISEEKAREILKRTGGDLIDAIMEAENEINGNAEAQKAFQDKILQQMGSDASEDGSQPTHWRTRDYSCSQHALENDGRLDGIDISIPVGPAVSKSDISCTFSKKHLAVAVRGDSVIDGDLFADTTADESTWTLEQGTLLISLVKKDAAHWPEIIVGEKHINPAERRKHILRVLGDLWRYFQGYDYLRQTRDQSLEKQTNWYIQDEVGLSIQHSDDPNAKVTPFLYLTPHGRMMPFSIVWPVKPIAQDEALTRDYCPQWLKEPSQRQGYLHTIFQGPTQFALDAHEKLLESWVQTAKGAAKATLTSLPVPTNQARSVHVHGASADAIAAIKAAGFNFAEAAEDADIIFADVPHGDKTSNQHPLNSVFFSTENTVLAFQAIIGAQSWLQPGFHLKTQITEFIGAAMMDSNSWWILTNDQAIPNVQTQKIITSDLDAAVRHADVGYTTAVKCVPSAIAEAEYHVVEKLALLTPDNGLYLWQKNSWVYRYPIELHDGKPEPYQVLGAEVEVSETQFRQYLDGKFGTSLYTDLDRQMAHIASEIIRFMLAVGSSDSKSFGVFSFRFSLGKSGEGIAPFVYQIRPVSVSDRLAFSSELVPTIAAVLAGSPSEESWKQIKPE
ncbi:hypothetical protein GGI12_004543 [Dipsacomyces acuminosporus]|nr:hypothetical protein GGI12_004543 [Dipsacomyces acuminosporus]